MNETVNAPIIHTELDPSTLPQQKYQRWTFVFVGGITMSVDACEEEEEIVQVNPNTLSFSYQKRDKKTRAVLIAQDFEAQNRITVSCEHLTRPIYPEGYNPAGKHITEIAQQLIRDEANRKLAAAAKASETTKPITDDDF